MMSFVEHIWYTLITLPLVRLRGEWNLFYIRLVSHKKVASAVNVKRIYTQHSIKKWIEEKNNSAIDWSSRHINTNTYTHIHIPISDCSARSLLHIVIQSIFWSHQCQFNGWTHDTHMFITQHTKPGISIISVCLDVSWWTDDKFIARELIGAKIKYIVLIFNKK